MRKAGEGDRDGEVACEDAETYDHATKSSGEVVGAKREARRTGDEKGVTLTKLFKADDMEAYLTSFERILRLRFRRTGGSSNWLLI